MPRTSNPRLRKGAEGRVGRAHLTTVARKGFMTADECDLINEIGIGIFDGYPKICLRAFRESSE